MPGGNFRLGMIAKNNLSAGEGSGEKLRPWPPRSIFCPGWRWRRTTPNFTEVTGLEEAHYYFATLAMLELAGGRGKDLVRRWVDAIRETPWNRTHAGTVMAADEGLTGEAPGPVLVGIRERK